MRARLSGGLNLVVCVIRSLITLFNVNQRGKTQWETKSTAMLLHGHKYVTVNGQISTPLFFWFEIFFLANNIYAILQT